MTAAVPLPSRLGDAALADIARALKGRGLALDLGLCTLRVRSEVVALAGPLQSVYRHFPWQPEPPWADLHVHLRHGGGFRRWLRPQVVFTADTQASFDPFPADTALPLLEWGANWLIGRRFNDLLLLHAGVVERDGFALVMPAMPGSGKSTLTAALSLRGWRLLSDEFGVFDLGSLRFRPALKPVGLKNASIGVIRDFAPGAELGPEFPKTRKGTVAHLAPPRESVDQRNTSAAPGAIVLPRWEAGARLRLEPVEPTVTFASLAFNAFNYTVMGAPAFEAVAALAQQCPAWQLVYSDLDEAVACMATEWPQVVERASRHVAARRSDGGRPGIEGDNP